MARPPVIKEARLLLQLNLAGFFFLAATGAVFINKAINAGYGIPDPRAFPEWTAASGFANLFAMVAGVIGAAAALGGLYHVRAWSQGSFPAAAYTGSMAWLLTLLALGFAIKEIVMGASVPNYKPDLAEPFGLGGTWYLRFALLRALVMGLLSMTQPCYLNM